MIYVAGHTGMVGSALVRKLGNVLTKTHKELDLMDYNQTNAFFAKERPEYVYLCAAKVGGLLANITYPADFMYDNLMIQSNVIHCAFKYKVKKLLFLGSSCMYPKDCPQPMKEEYLLSGKPESTNKAYVLAKLAGMEMCQAYKKQYGCNFVTLIPPNLYGINDTYDESSHVISAMIKKFHEAKDSVTCWGDGSARREFMYVDDMAEAMIFAMNNYDGDPLNVGVGSDISIKDLANLVSSIVGKKEIIWDTTKPVGVARKLLDCSKLKSIWNYNFTKLEDGIQIAYEDFK